MSADMWALMIWIVLPNVAISIHAWTTRHWWEAFEITFWIWISSIFPFLQTVFWLGAIGAPFLLAHQWLDERFSPDPDVHHELNELRDWWERVRKKGTP